MFDYNDLWAKTSPTKSLKTHMRESGEVALCLLNGSSFSNLPILLAEHLGVTEEEACNFACYIAAIHDIGKCHPLFQGKDAETLQHLEASNLNYPLIFHQDYRHELGGEDILKRIWTDGNRFVGEKPRRYIRQFSTVLKLHHQGKTGQSFPLEKVWPLGESSPYEDFWKPCQDALEKECCERFNPPRIDCEKITHMDCACMILTALVVIADWISSGEMFPDTEGLTREESSLAIRKHIVSLGLGESLLPPSDSFTDMWPWINRVGMRPLQQGIEAYLANKEDMPLAMIIESPMGEGKTEAGVYAAVKMARYWGKAGLYMALPTSATSNQMVGRLETLFSSHGLNHVKLIHSLSWLEPSVGDDNKNEDGRYWLSSSRKALLSPSAVGTVDQAMMAAMRIKYGVLRLLGLSNKVLIIDEIHAYDSYMATIIERLLEWCRDLRIPVVLMSATLPLWKKKQLMAVYGDSSNVKGSYQMITTAFADRTVEYEVFPKCTQEKSISLDLSVISNKSFCQMATEKAIASYRQGGCVCVIVNTVKRAQDIYDKISNIIPREDCLLFHSAFSVGRRTEIENRCLSLFSPDPQSRAKNGMILVATQVVEQSLDLDFDYMISEIAPVDLLLQRAGRLHRHSETLRPQGLQVPLLTVMAPENEEYNATELIYYKVLLNRTLVELSKKDKIEIPLDIPVMVEHVYQKNEVNDNEQEEFFKQLFAEDFLKGSAESYELRSPDEKNFIFASINSRSFLDDSDESFVAAQTRLTEKSIRFAVLPKHLYDQVERCLKVETGSGQIPTAVAKEIYRYTVSRREKAVKQVLENIEHLTGTGLLSGVLLYKADNDGSTYNETLELKNETMFICHDKDKGIILGNIS